MIKNYVTVALRNLVREKVYAVINIFGLAVGLAFCILSLLYVRHEWSFDQFHDHADQIYLVHKAKDPKSSRPLVWTGTPEPMTQALADFFPEVERVVKLYDASSSGLKSGVYVRRDTDVFTYSGLYADPSVFEMFSFPVVLGDLKSALMDVRSVVVSKEMATEIFGGENPVGKSVAIKAGKDFTDFMVSAVVDVPNHSSIQFDFLLSFERLLQGRSRGFYWGQWNFQTFVQLRPDTSIEDFKTRLFDCFEVHAADWLKGYRKNDPNYTIPLQLLPLKDLHFAFHLNFPLGEVSNPVYGYVFFGIALAVLIIACVNFMNLSLGLASTRFREVGMRKVLGASRLHLMRQFWGEALLLSVLALGVGIALVEMILPAFGGLVDRELSFPYRTMGLPLIGLVLVVGLVSGSYPALVMSRYRPVETLKGQQQIGGENRFSQALVALQFAFSLILIVTTLVMSDQLNFMQTKDLGFDPDQVVMIDTRGKTGLGEEGRARLLALYRKAQAEYDDITHVSMASISLGDEPYYGTWGTLPSGEEVGYRQFVVDYDFLETMGMALLAGRDFSRDFDADEKQSVVINKAMRDQLDLETVVGEKFPLRKKRTVIGVVDNFHMRSLHHPIELMTFNLKRGNGTLRYIVVRIDSDDIRGTLARLESIWQKVVLDRPFVFSFLDDDIARRYRNDERWGHIVQYAGVFAVFIACLGAFGLTSLAVARRSKEVGIRKVMGASAGQIIGLFSWAFVKLMGLACVAAFPIAYFLASHWLEDFAYRINVGTATFLMGGLLTFTVVIATVAAQALKAANANPVDALRHE